MPDSPDSAAQILEGTSVIAAEVFNGRLASVYALGSLAHGGFSLRLSDIDIGLVLEDPLRPEDEAHVEEIKRRVVDLGLPLAERLSIFWGSPESLRDGRPEGRFPPLDRLDLILHGRLLVGRDTREGLSQPTRQELGVGAVRFALQILRRPQEIEQILNPVRLVERGIRHVSKRVLFPVRFLYTARTGEIGPVEAAADHYRRFGGAASSVVAEAIRLRSETLVAEEELIVLLSNQLLPLYIEFLDDHVRRMQAYGETQLAAELLAWRRELGVPDSVSPR